jgi:FkbH-like protein
VVTTTVTTPVTTTGAPVKAETPLSGLAALRALHESGGVVSRYQEVAALVSQMTSGPRSGADLRRAGALIARTSPDELAAAHPDLELVRVCVLGHSTVEPVRDPLVAHLAQHGFVPQVTLGDFDGYVRELGDTGSAAYSPGADLALCILDAQIVFGQISGVWGVEDVRRTALAKVAELRRLAATYQQHGPGTLVLNTIPLLQTHLRQLVDRASRTELSILWRETNAAILTLGRDLSRVEVIDLDPLIAIAGAVNDPRMSSYAKLHLGEPLLAELAREVAHLLRALKGRTKKVLVLDADNTLWDGILGDDGPDGIAAATTFRGEAFGEFQRTIRQLAAQGVLLAVSSKNDQDAVMAVLRSHPDMQLRDDDFVAVRANWSPKDDNIRAIGEALNLGLDSFVFADDSAFERGLVGSSLPQVQIIHLDDEPALHAEALLRDGWFDTLVVTEEDRARGALYRADNGRVQLEMSSDTPAQYLDNLGVEITVGPPAPHEIGRLSQLTLRTNQFNLTTQRVQPADLQALLERDDSLVLSLASRDRFGGNGVIGGIFGHITDDTLHLDNMVMSCRVFARGIEQAAIRTVLLHARDLGLARVTASFRATAKNGKVRDLLPREGFCVVSESEASRTFLHDLTDIADVPTHVRVHSTMQGRLS